MALVPLTLVNLGAAPDALREQAAQLLFTAFAENWPEAWPTMEEARAEVAECSATPGWITFAALDGDGRLMGWIGGRPAYSRVWELHPLAVDEAVRRQGVARALVATLEDYCREQGALTLTLGSDDESDQTSLSGVDIYDNLPERLATIRNLRAHPYEIYQRLGFKIVGVMPDANGWGKPDILMAKRIATS